MGNRIEVSIKLYENYVNEKCNHTYVNKYPSKLSVTQFMDYSKGKRNVIIFDSST
ncbi:hypothetical protein GCM10008924_27620 [Gracilibacillus halotolerans]